MYVRWCVVDEVSSEGEEATRCDGPREKECRGGRAREGEGRSAAESMSGGVSSARSSEGEEESATAAVYSTSIWSERRKKEEGTIDLVPLGTFSPGSNHGPGLKHI